ncbi:transglycosylase domain-containing protein [Hydrogenophaga sp.]|uniref:transglycosylase domain-containing protein n=1 Tax=Hydrogenophaga sp. TaxID=1904254 RepID=UPI0035625756
MTGFRGKWARFLFWLKLVWFVLLVVVISGAAWFAAQEMRTSAYQARFFSRLAHKAQFELGDGPSPAIRFPGSAPFDDRMGYAKLPLFLDRLQQREFEIRQQARISPGMVDVLDKGYFAPYREKLQGGLSIQDCRGDLLYLRQQPARVIERFEDLPPPWVASLLFIENRELLDASQARRNPAVEWDRLAVAVFGALRNAGSDGGNTPGGSTLATQIEKYRHSPQGRTGSMGDKLQQMASASLRAYQAGEDTTLARQQVVVTYLNTMPLSAKAGFGEVHGIGDGLWAWFGRDFAEVQRILVENQGGAGDSPAAALLYKQVLSLQIAQRRPSFYLLAPIAELEEITNFHLRLLAKAQVISPQLRDAALAIPLTRSTERVASPDVAFVAQKAANAVRTHVSGLLDNSLYELDRLDLRVESSFDGQVQKNVTQFLRELRNPEQVKALGLNQKHLLGQGDPQDVVYSFNLYERGEHRNLLRVQADNFDQPLNVNDGSKLDLGSTAKLRTLVTYLDLIGRLHGRLSLMDEAELREQSFDAKDVLSIWAVAYLLQTPDKSLRPMLDAALARRYSASPNEVFFTGGGEHRFGNFNRADNDRSLSVQDALRSSVNLVFIRLMRDIVNHYMFLVPGSSAQILRDAGDPRRAAYLERFADREGQTFIRRFLTKYQGKNPQERQAALLDGLRTTSSRLAAIHRTIAPDASLEAFKAFVAEHLPQDKDASDERLERLYGQYAPQRMSLADRGYLAGVHPLELWLVGYLQTHPQATQTQVMEASAAQRQAVYQWLFSTHHKSAQDRRILTLLEGEGFLEVHRQWASMGYPFAALVSSYATALGASADRPGALAELMGILQNDGVRRLNSRILGLHFAAGTPYETVLQPRPVTAEQVLAPEVAQAVRAVMLGVVEEGTARRVLNAFVRSDGTPIPVRGKTGTGDQRFNTYGEGGRLLSSRVVNRTATFVFGIGDRFYGTITAFVPGEKAANYDFTSGLPVQLLKQLAPQLLPLLDAEREGTPDATACRG